MLAFDDSKHLPLYKGIVFKNHHDWPVISMQFKTSFLQYRPFKIHTTDFSKTLKPTIRALAMSSHFTRLSWSQLDLLLWAVTRWFNFFSPAIYDFSPSQTCFLQIPAHCMYLSFWATLASAPIGIFSNYNHQGVDSLNRQTQQQFFSAPWPSSVQMLGFVFGLYSTASQHVQAHLPGFPLWSRCSWCWRGNPRWWNACQVGEFVVRFWRQTISIKIIEDLRTDCRGHGGGFCFQCWWPTYTSISDCQGTGSGPLGMWMDFCLFLL